ncbi:MAG: hypothetical protein IPK04_09415 [Bdellovibrionales bacterium]|nr:hypothetical protein [Bdellovibrionales bacterium]
MDGVIFIEDYFDQIINKEVVPILINPTDIDIYELFQTQKIRSQEFLIVLDELLFNSEEHGQRPINLYLKKSFGSLVVAIEDFGQGIHTTLPCNQRLSDIKGKKSSSILRLSLEEGITGTGQVGRGLGLFYLSEFVLEKSAECLVASDSGLVIQSAQIFYERALAADICRNLIVIKVLADRIGL